MKNARKAWLRESESDFSARRCSKHVLDNDLFQANLKDFTVPSKDKAVLSLAGVGLGDAGNVYNPDSIELTFSNPYANLANGLLAINRA